MAHSPSRRWRRLPSTCLLGVAAGLCAADRSAPAAPPPVPAVRAAQEQPANEQGEKNGGPRAARESEPTGPPLSLAQCIQIALERQPNLAAQRATLPTDSADKGNGGVLDCLVPQLRIRREQAALGKQAACASLSQVEHETVYAVTRNYYTVLFARAQRKVVLEVIDQLKTSLGIAELLVGKAGAPRELNQEAVDRNRVFLRLAQDRLVDAEQGILRAHAALREAMGIGPDFAYSIPDVELPQPKVDVRREEVVALAVSRREELVKVVTAAEVTALEVQAQEKSHGFKKLTFAAAVDLHAQPVPTGTSDGEYRPGALGVEMPVYLIGNRATRVERASQLSARMGAVVDKTRNLITLEAEDAYYRWESAYRKLPGAAQAADLARGVARRQSAAWLEGQTVPYRDVLEAAVIAAQASSQYNEARYQLVLTLAALERITAGGLNPGLACGPMVSP